MRESKEEWILLKTLIRKLGTKKKYLVREIKRINRGITQLTKLGATTVRRTVASKTVKKHWTQTPAGRKHMSKLAVTRNRARRKEKE